MFFIFHGEDAFGQDEAVAALKHALGDPASIDLNVAVFDGRAALSVSDLRAACDAMPFLAPRRVVIVEGLLTRLLAREEEGQDETAPARGRGKGGAGRELLDQLVEYLPGLPPSTELVFLERRELPSRHALLKLADGKLGTARLFGPPRPEELPGWIVKRAAAHDGSVTPQAAQLLAQYAGGDLRALDGEIEKLITYAGARPVSPEDVQALVPAAGQASVFNMVDALGRRDTRQAAQLLHQLLALGEHPLGLLAMIVRQFRLLLQAKELAEGGQQTEQAIARQLGLPGFVAAKLARQARQFTLAQLEAIYRELLRIDLAIKSGEVEAETALDMFVAGLA